MLATIIPISLSTPIPLGPSADPIALLLPTEIPIDKVD